MKKSKILDEIKEYVDENSKETIMKFREIELIDVSDKSSRVVVNIEIVDDCVVFDKMYLNNEEVEMMIELKYDTLMIYKKRVKEDEDGTLLIELINEIYDDLDYLVSSLKLL